MKRIVLLALLLTFGLSATAQDDAPSLRGAWCYLVSIEDPHVNDFREVATMMRKSFPSPQARAKFDLDKKLFLNKMWGVVLRTEKYDKLTPAQRTQLGKDAVEWTLEFIGWKKGDVNAAPEGFQRKVLTDKEPCLAAEYKYSSAEDCFADGKYLFLDCWEAASKVSTTREFWCVLKYISVVAECQP